MQTYIAEIINENAAHRVRLLKANNQSLPVEFVAALGKEAALTVNGQATTLGELSRKLVEYQQADLQTIFTERGQLDIGSYLFGQLFGGMDGNERMRLRESAVDLRIVTEDEAAARLPWSLLYDDRRFLAATDWTVSLSAPPDDWKNIELPPSPRIMIVMPQANEWGKTSAEAHLQELERTLSKVNSLHVCGRHLCLVKTWEDFQEQLAIAEPDVLYFYGHGDSDTTNSKLIFASRDGNSEIKVSAAEFANALRVLGAKVPRLAYINCCLGDAGGLLGVGRQLGGVVPAVITNCTLAQVETAQAQALDIWRSILLDGLSPHEAVAAMRKNLAGRQAGGLSDARWLAPVVYCGYENWDFKPPKVYEQTIDPNWEYMLDRITPIGVALLEAGYMFDNSKPRALVFIWYGKRFQGVEEFYKRLEIDKMEFTVSETQEKIRAKPETRPIVFITSNSERRLPEPFLRRCVYHHIEFSEILVAEAVKSRRDEYPQLDEDFIKMAIRHFISLRAKPLRKPPSTGEFLVWLRILSIYAETSPVVLNENLADLPFLSVLLKDQQDFKDV